MHPSDLIEPAELLATARQFDVVIVDARKPAEYAKGHIPGAINFSTESRSAKYEAFHVSERDTRVVGYSEIEERLGRDGHSLLDVRDSDEHRGLDNTPCCARRGHIPGSVWIEWTRFLQGGRYKSPEAIRVLLRESGGDPESEIVPYCHRGARSASAYYALEHAGLPKVRNYFGLWHEWSARSQLPIRR